MAGVGREGKTKTRRRMGKGRRKGWRKSRIRRKWRKNVSKGTVRKLWGT